MSSEKPPMFTISTPETPLDLTLRRLDTNDEYIDTISYPRPMVRQMSLPSNLDHQTNTQYNQYNTNPQYTDYRYDSSRHTATPSPPSTLPISLSPPTNASRSTTTSPTPYSDDGYADKKEGDSPKFDGFILPKKRKNLWRPYDSRAVACGELDRDSDSSDSTASASDQEFKAPTMDPVKKRKLNMIQYMSNDTSNQQEDTIKRSVNEADNESSHVNGNNQSLPGKAESSKMSQQTESTSGYFSHMAEELTKSHLSLLNSYPEAREKMISGMKKRDIFGWGLKLTKPSPEGQKSQQVSEVKVEANSSQDNNSQSVCQDGEKTYIELQTVRPNTSSQPNQTEERVKEVPASEKSPFKVPKNDVLKSNTSPSIVQSKPNSPEKNTAKSPEKTSTQSYDNEKENIAVNGDGKVYVQTRDNVIKTFDESKNIPVKKRKEISLIDLVEEIEATAMRLEEEDETIKNKRNRRVTALLDQCNHVKLQALDFLMANVLIQDKEPHYKQKNEKVQKMLKGDKIGTVNMLDVLELQVEIGLN